MAGRGRLDQGQIRASAGAAGSITGAGRAVFARLGLDILAVSTRQGRGRVLLGLGFELAAAPLTLVRADACHEKSDDGGSAVGWAGGASHGFRF